MKKRNLYTSYKKSDESWIGDIPSHWSVFRLKHVFEITKRIVGETGYDVLSITQKGIKVKDITSGAGQLSMDYSKYQKVDKGDFAMNHMDLLTGFVDLSKYDGVVSPDYRVFKLKQNESYKKFLLYILQLSYTQKIFFKHGKGVSMLGRWRLPAENFKNFVIPLPPKPEQTTIANFLNYKLEKINRFISKKKQLIELLNEQKSATINQAVTKGLNPNVKMKDSGIEWLGEIPEHWEVWKLRFLTKITTGNKNTENKKENGEYDFFVRSQKIEKIDTYSFEGEGILTAGDGVGVGRVFHYINGKFDYHQRVYLFYDFSHIINGKFLFHYIKTNIKTELMYYNAKSTVDSIRLPVLKNFSVCVPSIKEQKAIVKHVELETETINRTIKTIQKEIILVEEYKTALIAEAVTGKIDVRDFVIPQSETTLAMTTK